MIHNEFIIDGLAKEYSQSSFWTADGDNKVRAKQNGSKTYQQEVFSDRL